MLGARSRELGNQGGGSSTTSFPTSSSSALQNAAPRHCTAILKPIRPWPCLLSRSPFWSSDLGAPHAVTDRDEYRRLWDGALPGALKGKSTTGYIWSEVAIPKILSEKPEAKMILLLRNPAHMAAAFHSQLVYSFQEDILDFEKAWRLQEPRATGRHIPVGCIGPSKLQYKRVCAVGDQLERFFDLVPEANRLIILFDDFIADTRAAYHRTLQFLELPDDGRTSFPRINENRNRRNTWLSKAHRAVPRMLGRLYAPTRSIATSLGISPSRVINRYTLSKQPRPPLDPAFEAELALVFTPQIEKIERLLDRDLSVWKRPRKPAAPNVAPPTSGA